MSGYYYITCGRCHETIEEGYPDDVTWTPCGCAPLRTYTLEQFRGELLGALESGEFRGWCPDLMNGVYQNLPCDICLPFMGLGKDDYCPCHYFGEVGAAKRAWIALEACGYLEEVNNAEL